MTWQDKYLSPSVESENIDFSRIRKFFKKYSFLIKHSLLPHAYPVEPQEKLPQIKAEGSLFAFCERIYQESLERIDKLEQKAFNLLSYITALFAFISLIFLQSKNNVILKIVLIVSMFLLLVSIVISYRCSNVKSIRKIFVQDIYDLEKEPPESIYNDKKASATFLQSAIFNGNVADNLADMLNAARYVLMTALVIGLLGSGIIMTVNYFTSKPKEDVQLSLTKELRDSALVLEDVLRRIDMKLENDKLPQSMLIMSTRFDSLSRQLFLLQQDLQKLRKASAKEIKPSLRNNEVPK